MSRAFASLLSIGFTLACGFSGLAFAALPAASVFVQKVTKREMADRLVYPGRVRSVIEALVTAESEGHVKQILRPVGSSVKKGETVLIIQNTDPVYRFAPVHVKAPVSGLVSQIAPSLMSKVDRGNVLFMITDPNKLKVEVEIPAAEVEHFKMGLAAQVLAAPGSGSRAGINVKLVGLSPLVDPKTGTATGTLEFQNRVDNKSIRPGVILQVQFEVNKRTSVVIPSSSLTYKDGKPHVRIVQDGKSKRIPVEVMSELGGQVEIRSGLEEGTQLVTRANKFIADGEAVQVDKEKIN